MAEVRIGRIGSDLVANVAVSLILPIGPTDGVYCDEYSVGVLRILSTDVLSEATIKVYTYDAQSNRWIEDPAERRTIGVGLDYTRRFDFRAINRTAVKFTSKTGTYDQIWTFA